MSVPHRTARTFALTSLALVAFAANSLLCRKALGAGAIDAASFTAARVASGAAVLAVLALARRGVVPARAPRFGGSARAAAWLVLYALAFSFAYRDLTAGTGALLLFGAVQLTMLLAAVRGGERPPPLEWLGLALAAGGLVALVLPGLAAPPLLAAGSMALAERVVLFHDAPPQGPGNAEVFEVGIGLYHGVIPLPHAAKRLKLEDPLRVRLMARRFRPNVGAVLDPKTRLDWNGRRWRGQTGTLRLCEDGKLAEVNAA